jgi:hypothetical protein
MFLLAVLNLIGTPFPQRGRVGALGVSALRALVVLPTWPIARWMSWPALGIASGVGVVVLGISTSLWWHTRNLRNASLRLSPPFGRVRRMRTR